MSFENPHPQRIQLKLFNIQGELIQELFNGFYSEALFNNSFDISNNPNGSYLIEVKIGEDEFVENIFLLA